MLLATSLADWTKCLLATGLVVLEDARRQALHNAEVCLATMVAAESTCHIGEKKDENFYSRATVNVFFIHFFFLIFKTYSETLVS